MVLDLYNSLPLDNDRSSLGLADNSTGGRGEEGLVPMGDQVQLITPSLLSSATTDALFSTGQTKIETRDVLYDERKQGF